MSIRYALVGGLLLLGLLLTSYGVVSTPHATVQKCTSADAANSTSPTPECSTYTERAWGAQLYTIAMGLGVTGLGVAVVVIDRRLARR